MQERLNKPEIQKTTQFLNKLKKDLVDVEGKRLQFPINEVRILRDKLLFWFRRTKSEIPSPQAGQLEIENKNKKYSDRVSKNEAQYANLKDALLGLLSRTDNNEDYYPEEREFFLQTVLEKSERGFETNGIGNIIKWHNNKPPSLRPLTKAERWVADSGFVELFTSGSYRLTEVSGDTDSKRLQFRAIENDLPKNCLGNVLNPGDPNNKLKVTLYGETYLIKPDTTFLTLQDKDGKNLVVIELNTKERKTIQIESLKSVNGGEVPINAPYALDLIRLLCDLVKEKRLSGIIGLDHLGNIPALQGKVITRSGEILPIESVSELEILFPTSIFGEIINVEYPRVSMTTPQDFLKPRDPEPAVDEDGNKIPGKYEKAGIFDWTSDWSQEEKEENESRGIKEKSIIDQVDMGYVNKDLPTSITSLELNKSTKDIDICKRLKIQCGENGYMTEEQEKENIRLGKIFTLKEIQTLMEMQMGFDKEGNIKEGYLKNDGNWNIFYVKGSYNKLCSLFCRWDSDSCEWHVGSGGFGLEWGGGKGTRVFSRN